MNIKVVTDVTREPITLDEVKNYLKYSEEVVEEDLLLNTMIKSARLQLERYINQSLAVKVIRVDVNYSELYNSAITLPMIPLNSITSVTRVERDGSETTLTLNQDYYILGEDIKLPYSIGSVSSDPLFRITMNVGYGATGGEALPEDLKLILYKIIADWYDKRENFSPTLSNDVMMLASQHIHYSVI